MNYIKNVKLFNNDALNTVNMIVEIEEGSKDKNELVDGKFDSIECVRKIKIKYPFYYGSFPQTLAGDNDPADAILLTDKKHKALDIVKVQPIALIKTVDDGEEDNKIVCVEGSIKDIQKELTKVLKFLCTYKGKKSNTVVDGTIYGAIDAIRDLRIANAAFKTKTGIKVAEAVKEIKKEIKKQVTANSDEKKKVTTLKVS